MKIPLTIDDLMVKMKNGMPKWTSRYGMMQTPSIYEFVGMVN
jgi:hypothetical protein